MAIGWQTVRVQAAGLGLCDKGHDKGLRQWQGERVNSTPVGAFKVAQEGYVGLATGLIAIAE